MTNETILTMLKQGLEIITDYMDEQSKTAKDLELMQYIETAEVFIEREGIVLEDVVSDQMLVSMYAMWLPPSVADRASSKDVNQSVIVLPAGARPSKYPASVSSERYPVSVSAVILSLSLAKK